MAKTSTIYMYLYILLLCLFASLIICAANIIIIYVNLARVATGKLRTQALLIMFGVIGSVMFQIFLPFKLFGTWQYSGQMSELIYNGLSILAFLLFYKAMRMD